MRILIVFSTKSLSFSVPFGKLNWKLKTRESPAYVALMPIERVGVDRQLYIMSIIYNFICE